MIRSSLPSRIALLSLALLLSACAGNGTVREQAPAATTVQGADAAPVADASATADLPTPVDTSAAQTASRDGAQTQAEQDFDAIYGASDIYNPIYDPTLPTPAEMPKSYDPWETWNRKVHTFNNAVDRGIAKPLAKAYAKVVPRPVRLGVGNFFNNLGQPVNVVNAFLQGQPSQAWSSLGRFLINSTVGIGGVFDPATKANIANKSEDFGQTLGVWGWKRSRYLELPLFGPRTVRDTFGLVGDAPLSSIRQVENDRTRVFLQGLQLVDVRTQLFAVDSLREGAADEYALVRDSWLQRRNYQIFGDRDEKKGNDNSLPDYLRDDDSNPTVPVDPMPIVPGSAAP